MQQGPAGLCARTASPACPASAPTLTLASDLPHQQGASLGPLLGAGLCHTTTGQDKCFPQKRGNRSGAREGRSVDFDWGPQPILVEDTLKLGARF